MPRKFHGSASRKQRVWVTLKSKFSDTHPLGAGNMGLQPLRLTQEGAGANATSPYNFLEYPDGQTTQYGTWTVRALRPFTMAAMHLVQAYDNTFVGFVGVGIQGGMVGTDGKCLLPVLGEVEAAKSFPLVVPAYPRGGSTTTLSDAVASGSSKSMRKVETGQFVYLSCTGAFSAQDAAVVRFLALL